MKFNLKQVGTLLFLVTCATQTFATPYTMPPPDESLIGQVQYRNAKQGDNVVTMAERYDLGYNAVEQANPQLNMGQGFQTGTRVQIPTQHLLPSEAREGIIVNLPEMRMYYFPPGTNKVLTYPIGIGKIGKMIPITRATITQKKENPTWVPPEDIREFNLEQGIVLPKVMPPGPDNPLGPYAIYMTIPTYLIHSTIFPESVGRRASFGCIRMYESDIKEFYPSVEGGLPIVIINSPNKIGWQKDRLYVEAHQPLEEHGEAFDASLPGLVHMIATSSKESTLVDWQLVAFVSQERDGLPHEIGMKISQ